MHFFDITCVAFKFIGYSISYIELLGTIFGLISVYLATQSNILTWSTGLLNEAFLFLLFFQVQLYADVFLQIYFFIVTLWGWYNWNKKENQQRYSTLSVKQKILLCCAIICSSFLTGILFKHIHEYFPYWFKIPASYAFIDSFILTGSIAATWLLAKKKIETWYVWIAVDLVCIFLYFLKGIYFLSIEYIIFLCLASYGLYNWRNELKND